MRRKFSRVLASLIAVAVLASAVFADEPAPELKTIEPEPLFAIFCFSDHFYMVGDLLVSPQMLNKTLLQQDLALTDLQRSSLNELSGRIQDSLVRYQSSSFKGISYEIIDREAGEAHKRMLDILRPTLADRVRELMIQYYGLLIVSPQDMRRMFHLTAKQEYSIESLRSEMFSRINKTLSQPLKDDVGPVCQMAVINTDELRALIKSAEQQVEEVFSSDQLPTKERMPVPTASIDK